MNTKLLNWYWLDRHNKFSPLLNIACKFNCTQEIDRPWILSREIQDELRTNNLLLLCFYFQQTFINLSSVENSIIFLLFWTFSRVIGISAIFYCKYFILWQYLLQKSSLQNWFYYFLSSFVLLQFKVQNN